MWAVLLVCEKERKNSNFPLRHPREAGQIIAPICTPINSPANGVYSCQWNSRCPKSQPITSLIIQTFSESIWKLILRVQDFLVKKNHFSYQKKINIWDIAIISKISDQWSKTRGRLVRSLPGVPGFIDSVLLGDAHKLDCPDHSSYFKNLLCVVGSPHITLCAQHHAKHLTASNSSHCSYSLIKYSCEGWEGMLVDYSEVTFKHTFHRKSRKHSKPGVSLHATSHPFLMLGQSTETTKTYENSV